CASHQTGSSAPHKAKRLVESTAIGNKNDRYTKTRITRTAAKATASSRLSIPAKAAVRSALNPAGPVIYTVTLFEVSDRSLSPTWETAILVSETDIFGMKAC